MSMTKSVLMGLVVCLSVAVPLVAQEGHPLVGSWHGSWGPDGNSRTDVTFVISFTGKGQVISGIINPGSNSATIQKATLDPQNWAVHFEADAKDQTGKPVHYVIDGKIENIGSIHRSIAGTWMTGSTK